MALRIRPCVLSAATALTALASLPADAGPNGGTVVGGSAALQGQGTGSVTINQATQNAIINWATFNIGKGETTTFNQPNSSSIALNRVIGGQGPSFLDGTLTANGRVFIVNGDGILFGSHSAINTAGFLATTNDIRNEDFMAGQSTGKYNFNIPGLPNASIVNLGSITASSGGFAALVAPGVRNAGTITATLGTVSLAAGNVFTLDFYGDRLITLAVSDQIAAAVKDVQTGETLKSLVGNTGKLSANGGRVQLTAAAARAVVDSVINNTGVIEAESIGTKNGMIVLSAATDASKPAGAPAQTVKLAGTISAAGKDKGTTGGTVVVVGGNIALAGATIDASGQAGGGKVLIGGDTGGGHPGAAAIELAKLETFAIPTATSVSVDAASVINASATGKGNGGKVVLWSDQETTFAGTILAKGGASGGSGGFVETSSHGVLNFAGTVDLRAPLGNVGTLLLDPADFYINPDTGAPEVPAGASVMTEAQVEGQLTLGNLTITTSTSTSPGGQNGDIFVYSNIGWSSNNTLTISAYRNINVEPGIAISNYATGDAPRPTGNLVLRADNSGTGTGTVKFIPGGGVDSGPSFGVVDFSASSGTVSIYYNPASNPAGSVVNATSYANPTSYNQYVIKNKGNSIQLTAYMLVNTVFDLQNVQNNLSGTYTLGRNIDASATAGWNGGAGFVPIGTSSAPFSGLFDGGGQTIDKLTIGSSAQLVGLFGRNDRAVRAVGLTNVNVTAVGNSQYVGALVGSNGGSVTDSYATGQVGNQLGLVPSGSVQGAYGGLVGLNDATGVVSNSHATVAVSVTAPQSAGSIDAGGLVGKNLGSINSSYADAAVTRQNTSPARSYLGGLVGWNVSGMIAQSYASGSVTGVGSNIYVGGLVGVLDGGSINQSYATGPVAGSALVGGLVGTSYGSVTQSYATGTVSGINSVGGLIGVNEFGSSVTQSYATGTVSGTNFVAGLVGINFGSVTQAYATGAVSGLTFVGGLVGNNTGNVTQSYWDTTTTGKTSSQGVGFNNPGGNFSAIGLTTSEFMKASNFSGWSFGTTGGAACASGGACWVMVDADGSLNNTNGAAGATRAMLISEYSTTITNDHQLQLVAMQPGANYKLASDFSLGVDLNNKSSMWSSAGFVPIGNISFGGFTGTFDGQNHTIDGLGIAPTDPKVNNIGLFGTIYGSVSNLALTNVSISANPNVGLPGQFVGALAGQNAGTVSNVSATGVVNGTPNGVTLAGVVAGGLVGQNGVFLNNNQSGTPGAITQSFANVSVTVGDSIVCQGLDCNGGQNNAGGLVGFNSPGSTITDSQALGTIAAGVFSNAGGLAGQNFGAISGTTSPSPSSVCIQGSAYACAGGAVSVGSLGTAGGLIGFNDGIVGNAFATGAVTGAAGVAADKQGNQNLTELGGLAGTNQGVIGLAFATGNVGTLGVAYLEVGGLVAKNSGSILQSFAAGNVVAGNNSNAGGLSGSNSPHSNGCGGCMVGDGDINIATIASSFATGNVTVGATSFAGGLSATGDGTFSLTSASGNVTGGANSVLGGLVGGMGVGNGASLISLSFATGAVQSTGPNSSVGGLVGANGGKILGSNASGPVIGTSQSYLGGLAGINVGWIKDSSATGSVTGSGSQNFTGGLVGLNFGTIDPSTSTGKVTSGPNSIVGGLVGANGAFGPFNNIPSGVVIPGSFPVGTVSSDSLATGSASGGLGSLVGPQFGENYPTSGLPAYPGVVNICNNGLCTILATGVLTDPNPPITNPPSFPPINPVSNQPLLPPVTTEAQLIQSLVQNITLAAVTLGDVVNVQPLNQPPRPGPGPGPGGLPPQFGARFFVPPALGAPHITDEVVLQIPNNIPPAQLQAMMNRLGLTILGSQGLSLLGVTSYRVHIGNGNSVASVIQALAAFQMIVAGAQANYTYGLAQELAQDPDLAGRTQEGDAAQYALGRLGVIDIHRLLKGTNVAVAVIDSQIDVQHPDLEGVIAGEYDAVGQADKPHAHGTGMAGAIAAHRRLMGIAPSARIYAIHAFSSGAASPESTTFNILKGLEWAASKGVRVINMSFAGPRDPSMERALKAAHDKGIILIAAAGNAGPKSPPLYPGADPNVIAVTATDVNDKLFAGANRGRYIAVAAPGVDILVTAPDGAYQLTTGTSVASAEVSGVAALLLERNPNLTPEDIRRILTSSARHLGSNDRNDDYGSGLVDPSRAIEVAGELNSATVTGSVRRPDEDRKGSR